MNDSVLTPDKLIKTLESGKIALRCSLLGEPFSETFHLEAVSWSDSNRTAGIWVSYTENPPSGPTRLNLSLHYRVILRQDGVENIIAQWSLGAEGECWVSVDDAQAAFLLADSMRRRVPISDPLLLAQYGSVRALLAAEPFNYHLAEKGSIKNGFFNQWEGFLAEQLREWRIASR